MANENRLDLIDRSSLGIGKTKREAFDNPAYADGWNSAIAIIENAPTVDAVEVVRCKDCKMWKCHGMPFDITKGTCHNPIFHFHHGHVIEECFMPVTNEMDFCSYGERREGE